MVLAVSTPSLPLQQQSVQRLISSCSSSAARLSFWSLPCRYDFSRSFAMHVHKGSVKTSTAKLIFTMFSICVACAMLALMQCIVDLDYF